MNLQGWGLPGSSIYPGTTLISWAGRLVANLLDMYKALDTGATSKTEIGTCVFGGLGFS